MAKSDDSTGGRVPIGTFMGVPVFADEVVDTVRFAPSVVLYFPPPGETYKPTDLGLADLHITLGDQHCGKADCTKCDPMERVVDGLSMRECIAAFQRIQQDEPAARGWKLTPNQLDAARVAWSAELKRKQAEQREKEENRVVVDLDDD